MPEPPGSGGRRGSEHYRLEVGGVAVDVVRKPIRHSRLAVYPPHGRVQVSVPRQLDEAAVREVILSRLDWIRRKCLAYTEHYGVALEG